MIFSCLLLHVQWALAASLISRPDPAIDIANASNLSASTSSWSPSCVNTSRYPEWAGEMDLVDCTYALSKWFNFAGKRNRNSITHLEFLTTATLKYKTAVIRGAERIFFSRQFVRHPPDNTWGLPSGCSHGKLYLSHNPPIILPTNPLHLRSGTCAVFVRMAKDFGDSTLPLTHSSNPPNQYFPGRHTSPIQVSNWDSLSIALRHLLHTCVGRDGSPGWTVRLGNIVLLIVPMESEFSRTWWSGDGDVGGEVGDGFDGGDAVAWVESE